MRWLIGLIVAVIALWGAAFLVFVATMSMQADRADEPSDALIVLTGGNARVERGLSLLAAESAPVLFISGVGPNVTLAEMLAAHTTPLVRDAILERGFEIVFDYDAQSTQANASEAAEFVRERGYQRIRLITAHYHMPRSLLEFRAALPGVTILREPVVPESFARTAWWRDAAGRRLVGQEFHKTLLASGRILLGR